ncbi:MAG: hypothetical protein JWR72_2654 [Flavisolibacter sp.]|jgi:hypothetical protein|nr:hypothetical protein [Flavisolibacter sp.]
MQEKQLFEYAVIRVVPRVEREEFLNVGIILYCRQTKFLQCLYKLDVERLRVFCPVADAVEIEKNLASFERICRGAKGSGPIGALDVASRFRWLTATRSTVVQSSKVHPGFCTDADETLQQLYTQLVL